MDKIPYHWLPEKIADLKVGEMITFPHNWPGVTDENVAKAQIALDTIADKSFSAGKACFDRGQWLSLSVTRTS